MNLPNKLTCIRMAAVPFFVAVFYLPGVPGHFVWALVLFVLASFTDFLDGQIARKRNLVTDFGKFMDPLADKVLVVSALICFTEMGLVPAPVVIVIIAREFAVTSLRLIAAPKGVVIAADIYGKMKTVAQMVWVITVLLQLALEENAIVLPFLAGFNSVMIWVVTALTVLSGVNYIWANRKLLSDV